MKTMKKMIIYPSKIKGKVSVSGSKNAALPIICAALATSKIVKLNNVPNIKDITNLNFILGKIGCNTNFKKNKLHIKSNPFYEKLFFDEVKSMRASYYLMSVFLTLFNEVEIYYPGGCNIGSRPIDFHLEGFKRAGCEYSESSQSIKIWAKELKPFIYKLPKKSMGATVNLLILASKINGKSIIENASTEPEIDDLISFLNKGYAFITRSKNDIIIYGNNKKKKFIKHKIIPDRIEAFTYICMGLNSKKLIVKNIETNHLKAPFYYLEKANANFNVLKNKIIIRKAPLNGICASSGDYPALSTDQLPLLYPVFLRAYGNSVFTEGIFERRFDTCHELMKMDAIIKIEDNKVYISNSPKLKAKDLYAKDLRGAASLLLEAIINQKSTLHNIEYLERGYDSIYKKLKKIGLNFKID